MNIRKNARSTVPLLVLCLLPSPVLAQSVTYSRTERITYQHDDAAWVIGLQAKVECIASAQAGDGCISPHAASETIYDGAMRPSAVRAHGKLQQSMGYHADGTLSWFEDGRGTVSRIEFPAWKRGIPLSIEFPVTPDEPAGSIRSAEVNDRGLITSVTDETDAKTCYQYDNMGRLTKITYPTESTAPGDRAKCDTSAWNATDLTFVPVAASNGIGAGGETHWRQTVVTGHGTKEIHFDAMWRPVLETTDDPTRPGSRSQVARRYDAAGRQVFQSYPVDVSANLSFSDQNLTGTTTVHDGLDRPVQVTQHSELGPLTTHTEYLHGAQTRVTNPRAVVTTTQVEAYDDPSGALPRSIAVNGEQFTRIVRDVAGQPLRIRRHNIGFTEDVTRVYAYDLLGRTLCQTTEPETGSTIQYVDAAGNVEWSVTGVAGITGGNQESCQYATADNAENAPRKVRRTYDARNRLKTLEFPDAYPQLLPGEPGYGQGFGDQTWSYWPDSLPKSVVTVNIPGANNPQNNYVYNRRRLLTTETQLLPAWYGYNLGHAYDRNGSVAGHFYPSGMSLDLAPDGLGRPTQAVGHWIDADNGQPRQQVFAGGVVYHPNGAIKSFGYGNGVAHAMDQNERKLPLNVSSKLGGASLHDDSYTYDGNGNVAAIVDGATAGATDRTMEYDPFDRLTRVFSTMYAASGNEATYAYNALDDLTEVKAPGRHHFYCYNIKRQLENIKTGSCSGPTVMGLGYDANGNLVNRNGLLKLDFDHGNRLREVYNGPPENRNVIERYRYDAHGRRILAVNLAQGNVFSQYGMDGKLYYQQNARTGQQRRIDHVYLGGSLVAQRESALTGNRNVVTKFQHTDALGSPVLVTNNVGGVIERARYEPYGKQLTTPANTGNDRPGYTGHVEDRVTGLTYMQQRFFDPDLGIFTSIDPVSVGVQNGANFNRYWYGSSNPYTFVDPQGACTGSRISNRDGTCALTGDFTTQGAGPSFPGTKTVVEEASLLQFFYEGTRYNSETAFAANEPLYCAGGFDCDMLFNQSQFLNGEISRDEYYDRMQAQGKGGMLGATVAGSLYTTGRIAVAAGAYLKKNVRVDGPSPGLWYANGRVVGISLRNSNFNARLDYAPIPKSQGTPVLHVNFGRSGRGEAPHIVLFDPRWYTYTPWK